MNDKSNSRNPFAAPAAADHERRILWARRTSSSSVRLWPRCS